MKNEIAKIFDLIQKGNNIEAVRLAKSLFNKFPNNINSLKVLAYSFIQIGNFEKVVEILSQGYEDQKNLKDYDYYNNMGYAYLQLEDFEQSIEYLKKAIQIKPENVQAYISLADTYQKLKNFEIAYQTINKALTLALSDPRGFDIEKNINLLLLKLEIDSSLNKTNETKALFIKLLKEAFNADLFFLLTRLHGSLEDNYELVLLAESKLKLNDKNYFKGLAQKINYEASICFGLGSYYQKKDDQKSEEFYIQANQKVFGFSRYNSHSYQANILAIIENYNQEFIDYDESPSKDGQDNFFIVGSPRSGTTLVESIITSNNKVFSGGELNLAKRTIENYIFSKNKSIKEFKEDFLNSYLTKTSFIKNNFNFIVDKMPENFLFLGQLQKILPSSKFIRVFRNPWDIATSLYKERYILNVPYSTSFFNIGIFLSNFEAINIFWSQNIKRKENIFDLKYEELVRMPEVLQKKLYDFLGLKNDEYDASKRDNFFSNTASMGQIKGKIHQKSVHKDIFKSKKQEFYDAFFSQRHYWQKKEIIDKNTNDFFGYSLDNEA